ncbi:glycosyltransferase family 2 protein [Cellulomonas endophytica]|uniref:glycosyltransferase family 2 protein n=1 Tax=Cellulomonas endophytica TaxID=2494735 RepID=UPI00101292EB|nr:glycosyltransferase family 2 protein [Cellulomonas endophytica]
MSDSTATLEPVARGILPAPLVPLSPTASVPALDGPTDDEKLAYLRGGQHRWLFVLSALAFAGVAASLAGLALRSYWTLVFLVPLGLMLVEQALALVTSTRRRRLTLGEHVATVRSWDPVVAPSVDVFIPTSGEDLEVLATTTAAALRLDWDGSLLVHLLDDAARPEVERLAVALGARYLARPGSAFKKAGNLQHALERTEGEHVLILDADFVPRPDLLRELVPYLDDPAVGIVQSPQFFATARSMKWLERCAGATQEMFFRFIQPSRDAVDAAICVGTSAVYRRAALDAIGGFPLVGHSEDVVTGVRMRDAGFSLRYVPVVLSRGVCPDDLDAFIAQQYRWCEGSMALMTDRRWIADESISGRQRLSFWAGFLYYVNTALFAVVAPLPLLVMAFFFPGSIAPENSLPLAGAVLLWLVVLPAVSRSRWRPEVLRVQTIYGFAHLFCILDMLRGRVAEWVPTGARAVRSPVAHRVRRFMGGYLLATQGLVALGLTLGVVHHGLGEYWSTLALALLMAYVALPVASAALRPSAPADAVLVRSPGDALPLLLGGGR